MTLERKTFLRTTAATIAAASGLAFRVCAESAAEFGAGPEFEPWLTWNQDAHRPLATVRAGILAANAWNSQPWLFHVADNRVDAYADTTRNLGAFDPYRRELYISLGCTLENLILASAANGFSATLSPSAGELQPSAFRPQEPVASIALLRPRHRQAGSTMRSLIVTRTAIRTNHGAPCPMMYELRWTPIRTWTGAYACFYIRINGTSKRLST